MHGTVRHELAVSITRSQPPQRRPQRDVGPATAPALLLVELNLRAGRELANHVARRTGARVALGTGELTRLEVHVVSEVDLFKIGRFDFDFKEVFDNAT